MLLPKPRVAVVTYNSDVQTDCWPHCQQPRELPPIAQSSELRRAPLTVRVFGREWVSTPVFGNINIALILGVLQFVSTFLIAWLYERHSSNKLDAPSDEIKHEVEKELGH